jgi:hypothetical protein
MADMNSKDAPSTDQPGQNGMMSIQAARRKRLLFIGGAIGLAVGASAALLFAVDLYLHWQVEQSTGVNVWGYRGSTMAPKPPGGYRIAILGGGAAFGDGVAWRETMPAILERKLRFLLPAQAFSVVNLGYKNEGAYSLKFTLQDYDYLNYDLVCLYDGYDDIAPAINGGQNVTAVRHDSPVFRLTGYLPILPLILRERAAAAIRRDPDGRVARKARESRPPAQDGTMTGCGAPWDDYCRSIRDAITYARQRGKDVLFVTQPYLVGDIRIQHVTQQRELAAMLERFFGDDRHVNYVNLGDAINLVKPEMSLDHVHLTPDGYATLASELVEPVLEMASRSGMTW